MAKKGLGRGLDVLLGDAPEDKAGAAAPRPGQAKLPIEYIIPDPKQPRKSFADEAISELATSIDEKGLLQPILVRPVPGKDDQYMIVAGERRWRAAQKARLHEVPVSIREFTDDEAAEIALIENIQRVDLNPMEEADAYHHLAASHKRSQKEIAEAVGKSRSHVANMMRLTQLPQKVRDRVREGDLSMGHARAILSSADPEKVAQYVLERGLSVRDTEAYSRASLGNIDALEHGGKKAKKKKDKSAPKDADTRALERDISESLGLGVAIEHKGKKGGTLKIDYRNLEQLDEVCRRLMKTGI